MMKILKTIKNFFQKIFKFIDRFIIIPVSKFVLSITKNIGNSGKMIESWLSKTNTLLFISLFISLLLFIIIDQEIIKYSQSTAEVLKSQPVTVKYNSESFVVEGIPETVDITLIGGKTDLFIAKQMPSPEIIVDLENLGVGKHEVQIKYNQAVGNLQYMVSPSTVTVEIFDKISQTFTVTTDLLNQDELDKKIIVENVTLDNDKVVVKGAKHKLVEVATVKALIDLKELSDAKEGQYKLENIVLKAYNSSGEVVDVEMIPNKLNATVTIKSPNAELPIKIIPKGEVVFGKAIRSITSSVDVITVYGPSDVIEELKSKGIEVEIDVQDLKEDKVYKVDLAKPTGVKSMSDTSLTITVKLDTISNKVIEDIKLTFRDTKEGYIANVIDVSDEKISVDVAGVKSVIDSINSGDIVAYVDLKGKGPGEHTVDVIIEGKDSRVTYSTRKTKIKIIIAKKNS